MRSLPPAPTRRLQAIGPSQIAKIHNVPRHVAYYWVNINNFLPGAFKDTETGRWLVPLHHAVIDPTARPVWIPGSWTRPPTGKPRGRPPGKATKPYPKGVKRPRPKKQ